MEYKKPHLSCAEQADKLIRQGLVGDRAEIEQRLTGVSYYRLSAYWHPFRREMTDAEGNVSYHFPDTSFNVIWNHYLFDRRLRLLFMDAIERIEVALRSRLVDYYTQDHSPFDYVQEPQCGTRLATLEKQAGIVDGRCDFKNCKYACVQHFFRKYGDYHQHLPFWIFAEVTEFGFMSLFYRGASFSLRTRIAKEWGLTSPTLISWLSCLNSLRNTCAHHGRIWNNGWGLKPKFPHWSNKRQRVWYCQYSEEKQLWEYVRNADARPSIDQTKTAALLFICRYLMRQIAPLSRWHGRVEALFAEFEDSGINFRTMGLPLHWQRHPLWRGRAAQVRVKN